MIRFLMFSAVFLITACTTVTPGDIRRLPEELKGCQSIDKGNASYYADKFHGRKTANGERFSNNDMTAAHRTFPFGTRLRVTNQHNGESVDVRVNDRGPFIKGRIVDLSKAAARKINMIGAGVVPVMVCRL